MDVAMEDDHFFADLNRRISLLIMDEDDGEDSVTHYPFSLNTLQVLPQAAVIHQHQPQLPPETCFYYGTAVSQDCQREIKGTGVFIPRSSSSSSQPMATTTIRRKNKKQAGGKAGRTNSSAGSLQAAISYKKLQPVSSKSSRVLSQLA